MKTTTAYLLAADIMLFVHVLFVAFVVFGLPLIFLGKLFSWSWVRNPWFRIMHVAAIGVVVLQSWLGVLCPLTVWENAFRARAGDTVYSGTFISHWMQKILYYNAQQWVFVVTYTIFGILVVWSWFWVRPKPFASSAVDQE